MRIIDADKLKVHYSWLHDNTTLYKKDVDDIVDVQPTIDALPVVRGEWIENPTKDSVLCSYCHADWNLFDNDTYRFCYCPNCGAKMEDKPCG